MKKATITCALCKTHSNLVEYKGKFICQGCIDHVKAEQY